METVRESLQQDLQQYYRSPLFTLKQVPRNCSIHCVAEHHLLPSPQKPLAEILHQVFLLLGTLERLLK